jgi:hypothetical protein
VQPDGVQPKLGNPILALDVDVRRLIPITREKEKPVWADPDDSWH